MAIVDIWLVIAGQWRPPLALADGRVLATALDYTAVRNGLVMAGRRITPVQFAGIRVMEQAAIAALNGAPEA